MSKRTQMEFGKKASKRKNLLDGMRREKIIRKVSKKSSAQILTSNTIQKEGGKKGRGRGMIF